MKFLMIAAACGAMALAGTAQAQEAGRATIVVTGRGLVEAMPDTFSLTAQAVGRGADQAEAVRRMAETQTSVTDAISHLKGLTAAEVTTGLPSVTPTYSGDCERSAREACQPTGYVAVLDVLMTGQPADRGGDAVSLAAERGAQHARLNGLSLSDPSAARREAARAAVTDARRQAEDIALASGQRIVGVRQVQTSGAGGDDPFYGAQVDGNFTFGLYGFNEAETPITLTPGPVSVRANLTVAFEIE